MTEENVKSARVVVEVVAGVIPEKPDDTWTKRWAITDEETLKLFSKEELISLCMRMARTVLELIEKGPTTSVEKNYAKENARLKGQLKEYKYWHDQFIAKLTAYIPEKYDTEDDPEAIILRWAKDMETS